MAGFTQLGVRLRHRLIRLRVRRWIGPTLCAIPYAASVAWLCQKGQVWIALLMLSPAVLMGLLVLMTLLLARAEFHGKGLRVW